MAWGELLFGPRGVLTAVFHILDDRRKIREKIRDRTAISKNGNDNSQTTDTYHQSDLSLLPDFLIDGQFSTFFFLFLFTIIIEFGSIRERKTLSFTIFV